MGKHGKKKKKTRPYVPSVKLIKKPDYIIYTDGGCLQNPGGIGGYGAVVMKPDDEEHRQELSGAYFPTTNNRMEIMAVIKALESLHDNWTSAKIYSDSSYVVHTADGKWQSIKNHDLWKQYTALTAEKQIEYHWVRGHNNDPYNERCDQLATDAMENMIPQTDTGYDPAEMMHAKTPQGVRLETGAMYHKIDVPEEYHGAWRYQTKAEFLQAGVNEGCAETLEGLLRKTNPSFRDYASIKSCGIDKWSRTSRTTLESLFGTDIWPILMANLKDNEADCLNAFRWYGRGLPLDMAIRKVQVSSEISRNAVNVKRQKNRTKT